MDYKKILKLAKSVNYFEDAEFQSIVNENSILIKNSKTNDIWSIDYRINEDEVLLFDTNNAILVEQAFEKEVSIKDISKEIVKKVFVEKDKNFYEEVKEKIKNSCSMKKKKMNKKAIEVADKKSGKEYSELFEKAPTQAKEIIENLYSKSINKIQAISEMTKEFIENSAFLFEENEIKRGIFVDPILIMEAYKNKIAKREKFFESIDNFIEFEKSVKEIFEYNEIPLDNLKLVFENIEIGKDIGSTITKNLLKLKKENNLKFNLSEISKKIKTAYSDSFLIESLQEYSEMGLSNIIHHAVKDSAYSLGGERYRFLKTNALGMHMEDVLDILKDIDNVLGYFMGMNEEDFRELMYLRHIVETCYKTGNLDSELIMNAVNQFNSKFIKPKDVAVQVAALEVK